MSFWQLFIFMNVIEHQSFSKAANTCGLTQPTVSSHIKQLEDYLGCVLIDRIEKKAVPTRAGDILYSYAKRLMALRSKAEAAIGDFLGNVKGSMTVGGSTIPGVYILPELLARFRETYPNIRFSLDIDSTENIIRKLNDGQIELGIVGSISDQKTIEQRQIISDELMVVIPGSHRWSKREAIRFDSLKKEPFIKRENGSGTWNSFRNGLKRAGFDSEELNVVAEIHHTNGVISGIKNRLGVSVLSPIAVAGEISDRSLKTLRIASVDLNRNFYLTWSSKRSMSPITSLLKDFAEARFIGSK